MNQTGAVLLEDETVNKTMGQPVKVPSRNETTHTIYSRGTTKGVLINGIQLLVDDAIDAPEPAAHGSACDYYSSLECQDCVAMWGTSTTSTGGNWDTCWAPGDYLWTEDDTEVTKCLIDLHYQQQTKCISVQGSSCEKVKGESKILNAEMDALGAPQLTSGASRGMQAGAEAMIGMEVKSWEDHFLYTWDYLAVDGFVFIGHQDPELAGDDYVLFIRFGGEEQC